MKIELIVHSWRASSMSQIIPETSAYFDKTCVIERPDGFYWVKQETKIGRAHV